MLGFSCGGLTYRRRWSSSRRDWSARANSGAMVAGPEVPSHATDAADDDVTALRTNGYLVLHGAIADRLCLGRRRAR